MLVFLSLISAVASAPYVLYSGLVPQYTPYHVPYGAHHYAVVPQVAQVAPVPQAQVVDPMNYAVTSAYPIPDTPQETNARLITVSSLQTAAGTLMEHAAGSPEIAALMTAASLASTATTVRGNVEFQQNPLTGQMATFKGYLNGGGIMANMKYRIGVGTDCAEANFRTVQEVTSPFFLLNGFYIKGATNSFNIDMQGGLPSVRGMRLMVQGPGLATDIIGCSEALLV